MKRILIAITLALICFSACAAQDPLVVRTPKITGYVVLPVNADQCRAVRMTFTLTNQTDTPFYSQRPYTGAGYSLYRSFGDAGYKPLQGRYMIGVSLNGGTDGYPYRWGFHGTLQPGRTTTVTGYLTIVEVGSYKISAAVLKGGVPVAGYTYSIGSVIVSPCTYIAPPPPPRPIRAQPIYPVFNGQYGYPPIVPYVINGYNYVPAGKFLFEIAGGVYLEGPYVLINVPGYRLVTVPGSQYGWLNGVPITMPMPVYMYGGVPYIAPRVIVPMMGGSMWWNQYNRQMFVNGPWMPGY